MTVTPELVQKINESFDRMKVAHDISSDKELAELTKVSAKTISLIRHGKLTRVLHFVSAALTGTYHHTEAQP
jgi:uncharacterized beta-barrel protein YwiB (DUF1934 family)